MICRFSPRAVATVACWWLSLAVCSWVSVAVCGQIPVAPPERVDTERSVEKQRDAARDARNRVRQGPEPVAEVVEPEPVAEVVEPEPKEELERVPVTTPADPAQQSLFEELPSEQKLL